MTCGPGLRAGPHGDVLVLDWATKSILDELRFQHTVYPDSHKGLAGVSWYGDRLLIAAECELLECAIRPLRILQSRTFPFLNDVHYLAGAEDRIWVCNTGLDCVEVFDSRWNLLETRDLLGPLRRRLRYSKTSLYYVLKRGYEQLRGWRQPYAHLPDRPWLCNTRKLLISNAYRKRERELRFSLFRPHILHPNHIQVLDNDVWVTNNTTGEIVSLNQGTILTNGLGRAHDGVVEGEEHFATDCIENRVVVHEFQAQGPSLGKKIRDRVVTTCREEGFVRGVAAVDDRVYAGITVRRGCEDQYGSARIIELDRKTLRRIDEWEIPRRYGQQVYSVVDASRQYAGYHPETTAGEQLADAVSHR